MRVLTQRMVRRANSYQWPVIAREVNARSGDQRSQSGHEVERLKHHVGGALPIRRLQSLVNETLGGPRESFGADRRPRNGPAQTFEFGALVGSDDHTRV